LYLDLSSPKGQLTTERIRQLCISKIIRVKSLLCRKSSTRNQQKIHNLNVAKAQNSRFINIGQNKKIQ